MDGAIVIAVFFLTSCVAGIPVRSAGLQVSPGRAARFIGDTVRLNCSDPTESLNWIHQGVNTEEPAYVYSSGIGILLKYGILGRFTVETDDSSGSCDLVIHRVEASDAGKYICRRDDGGQREIELIVIVSSPKCESNSSLIDVLIENECGMEPDYLELKCSVGYHGNLPPVLEWRHSSNLGEIIPSGLPKIHSTTNNSLVIQSATRKSNIQLNATSFLCVVQAMDAGEQSYGCDTGSISVMYFVNSTKIRTIPYPEQQATVSCIVDTSASCDYRWRGITSSTNNSIEFVGQTIRLLSPDFENLQCVADCRIRERYCRAEPLLLKFVRTRVDTSSPTYPDVLVICILIVIAVAACVAIIAIISIWKSGKLDPHKGSKHLKRNEERMLLKRNVDHPPQIDIWRNAPRVIDCLYNESKWIDCLKSRGILSGKEHNELIEESVNKKRNREAFRETLNRYINTKEKFNQLLGILIEVDPNLTKSVDSSDESIAQFVRDNISKLIECLETDNGLAECLLSKGVLSSEQYEELTNKSNWKCFQEQNRELLKNVLLSNLESKDIQRMLMSALVETDQRHIFNFITNSKATVLINDDDHRVLTGEELKRIDSNLFHLTSSLVPTKPFLESLLREDCITQRHLNRIDAQPTSNDKNKELLSIVKRRSYHDFKTFKRVLQTTQKNSMIIPLLEQNTDYVISVHCEVKSVQGVEDVKVLERRMAGKLTDPTIHAQSSQLNGFHKAGIDLIGASPTGSVIVYFSCKTFQSIIDLKQMVDIGEMKNKLQDLINSILRSSNSMTRVELDVSLADSEYQACIKRARETMYLETDSFETQEICYFRFLPEELLEMILKKSVVGIMIYQWITTVLDFESEFRSYTLFTEVSIKSWRTANSCLKSVMYQWMQTRKLKREAALKKLLVQRIRENSDVLTSVLNCHSVFLDCLERENVLTETERRMIIGDENEESILVNTFDHDALQIPDKLNKRQRRMKITNTRLLKCVLKRPYRQILKFCKVLEENCFQHLLNFLVSSKRLPRFGKIWMLDNKTRFVISAHEETLANRFRIQFETTQKKEKERKKAEDATSDSETYSVRNVIGESHQSALTPPPQTESNLLNILHEKGCISNLYREYLKHKTPEKQTSEFVQLLKSGSIEAFEIAVEFLKHTGQEDVLGYLNGNYYKDIQLVANFKLAEGTAEVFGVVWFENRIYVVCDDAKKVYVFSDQRPFAESKADSITIVDMTNPWDMVASRFSRLIIISEQSKEYIWKIQMPSRMISEWNMGGEAKGLSINSSDELIVVVRRDRFYLKIFKCSDAEELKSIPLLIDVQQVYHAVQSSNQNFVVSYMKSYNPAEYLISELSVGEMKFIRTFHPRPIETGTEPILNYWDSYHLSIDENDNIFVAGRCSYNDTMLMLNSRLNENKTLQHSIYQTKRVCYVREKHLLIVGHSSYEPASVSVFNLIPL